MPWLRGWEKLFPGDSPVLINSNGMKYGDEFIRAMTRICSFDVDCIFFGHGDSKKAECNRALKRTLDKIKIASSINT